VHEIKGWDDLRRRLDPHDRRCFAFFHPALVDEPLIFVEVALCGEIPGSIHTLLDSEGGADNAGPEASVAVFYSISNCQEGLRGISFGIPIKQVVEERRAIPLLKTLVTLSPPSFRSWQSGRCLRALAYLRASMALLQGPEQG
jgi:malonyl-CoA decarboxylase